jgi:uncharacterized Zn finger protein
MKLTAACLRLLKGGAEPVRLDKAHRLFVTGGVFEFPALPGSTDRVFAVRGSGAAEYTVTVAGRKARCACPDHKVRGQRCKHVLAAAIAAMVSR